MKKIVLIGILLLSGCIGTHYHHPYKHHRANAKLWWQADTAPITSNNPWEKFVPECEAKADVRVSFDNPVLFPKGWVYKPEPVEGKILKLKLRRALKSLNKELERSQKRLGRLFDNPFDEVY